MSIDALKQQWTEAAAKGDHATAYSLEQEIDALERQARREAVQRQADKAAKKRLEAVEDAAATLGAIDNHKAIRAEFEALVAELEQAAQAVNALLNRVESEAPRLVHSYPRWARYDDAELQEAYNEALGAGKNPAFEPLRLGLRLPAVLAILRERGLRGLTACQVADFRF